MWAETKKEFAFDVIRNDDVEKANNKLSIKK
jgi:hypothetical protein